MIEVYEFRVPETKARQVLPDGCGHLVGDDVRVIRVKSGDALATQIIHLEREFTAAGELFFYSWDVYRRYSRAELESSGWLHARIAKVIEPAGEECGTLYDDSVACPACGSGGHQVGPLRLNLKKQLKWDFAETIAGEILVSARAASVIQSLIEHCASLPPVEFLSTHPPYMQLCAKHHVDLDGTTSVGWSPADVSAGGGACSMCNLVGANLLSEVTLSEAPVASAFAMTRQLIGVRRGLLRPRGVLLLSQALYRAVSYSNLRGLEFEATHVRGR